MIEKVIECNVCGKEFKTRGNRSKYCSKKCLNKAVYEKRKTDEKRKIWVKEYTKREDVVERVRKSRKKRGWRDMGIKGMTIEKYNKMLVEQNGVCAICGEKEKAIDKRSGKRRDLAVDHCHRTGKIRALLCGCCNGGMGLFKDNIDIMASAISYLQQDR